MTRPPKRAPRARLLLVEDDRDLQWVLAGSLRKEGYQVRCAHSAETGLAMSRKRAADLIILDVMLPEMDGFELAGILRRETRAPILFLTAKKEESDLLVGFKLGGDDFITKPFSTAEVLARVAAVLKRSSESAASPARGAAIFGGLIIDWDRREVRVNGAYVELAPREFEVLHALANSRGKVLSRERLLEELWGYAPELEISTRTIDQHVARLRRKLGAEGARIMTIKNLGYRLRTH